MAESLCLNRFLYTPQTPREDACESTGKLRRVSDAGEGRGVALFLPQRGLARRSCTAPARIVLGGFQPPFLLAVAHSLLLKCAYRRDGATCGVESARRTDRGANERADGPRALRPSCGTLQTYVGVGLAFTCLHLHPLSHCQNQNPMALVVVTTYNTARFEPANLARMRRSSFGQGSFLSVRWPAHPLMISGAFAQNTMQDS